MRNLCLALLFINLLIAAWYGWIEAPDRPPQSASPPALALFQAGQPPKGGPNSGSTGYPGEQSGGCLRIGPWADDTAMQQAGVRLAARGIAATPTAMDARIWLGYWVQIGGFETVEAAEAARRRLLAGGLTDALLMQEGAQSLISLGVFRDRGRAERIASRGRELGFPASIRDRFRPGVEMWLLLRPRQGETLRPEDLRQSEDLIILRSEPAPCDGVTGAAGIPEAGQTL